MREIKFRAKIKGDAGVYKAWSIDWLWQKALVSRACGDEYVKFDRIEALMQYTGLKDRNGAKIFEGDIVKAWMYDDEFHILKIYFEDGAFLIDFQDSDSDLTTIGWFIENGGNVEIIGNIYENPELLGTLWKS